MRIICFYLDDPNPLCILLLPFFLYSLVVLCLDAYVNLTFMSCKTELSVRATVRKFPPLSGKSSKINFAYFLTIKSYLE